MLLVDIVVIVVVVLSVSGMVETGGGLQSAPRIFSRRWRETETVFENLFKFALFVINV